MIERRTRYGFISTTQFHERLQHGLNPWQPHEYSLKVFLIHQEIFQVLASITLMSCSVWQREEHVREICQFREIHK
jgi:hypothetical protein